MIVWLVTSGEPIPSEKERPHRTGLLSQLLSENGNEVVWWTTTFDHQKKKYLYDCNTEVVVGVKLNRVYLHSRTRYGKNLSLFRIKNHYEVSKSFRNEITKKNSPDLIFCSFPTIDLAYECVKYGIKFNIPVVVDVRDLWPDIFLLPFPKALRTIVRIAIKPMVDKTNYIFENCYSITGVSESYLKYGLKYGKRLRTEVDRVFPLGYDDSGFNKISFNNCDFGFLKIDTKSINVWFVGTFGRSYDLLTVIKAAREIERINPLINFIFTGDGEQMDLWKKASQGIRNIVFTGWVSKSELKYISQNSHIGLMAYAKNAPQGLPNKIFEYMASGLTILSSLQSEAKELIESEGIGMCYEPQNAEDLVSKLMLMTNSIENLNLLKKRSKTVFEEKFNSSIIYKDLVEYLQQITSIQK